MKKKQSFKTGMYNPLLMVDYSHTICDLSYSYCAGYQSEIQAKIVAQGDNRLSSFGMDRWSNHFSTQKFAM